MLNISRKTDIKNLILSKKNLILSYPIENTQSDINHAAKLFNLGVDIFIFDPGFLTSKSALEFGFKLQQLCSLFNILFFVKDRADLALILEADGIHLDTGSIDIRYIKRILSSETIFGTNIDSENTNIDEFDYVISTKNLNISKPCFSDVLLCPKTLSSKIFINSSDVSLIKKYKRNYVSDID